MANVQGTTSGSGGSASEKDKDSTGVAYDPWVKKEIAGQTGSTRSGSTNNVVTANQSSSKSTDSTGVPYLPSLFQLQLSPYHLQCQPCP